LKKLRLKILFNMMESPKTWKKNHENHVPMWKNDLLKGTFTNKFCIGNVCNFPIVCMIFMMAILLLNFAMFPSGEGIVDTALLCKVAMGFYGFGILWYICCILIDNWYLYT